MFRMNSYVSHTAHGIAKITSIAYRRVGNEDMELYVLTTPDDHTIMVPVPVAESRIRQLITPSFVPKVLAAVTEGFRDVHNHHTWNRRYRMYMDKLHTNNALDIAFVYGALMKLRQTKDLSFGERKLLDIATKLLTDELSIVLNNIPYKVKEQIDAQLT